MGLLQVFNETCEICCAGGPALNWKWGTSTRHSLHAKVNWKSFCIDAFATNHTLLTLAQSRAWRTPDITNTLTLYAHVRVINYTLEVNLLVDAPPTAPWLACLNGKFTATYPDLR